MTELDNRILKEAQYLLSNKSTIRETAKNFGISKSTVHYDMSIKLIKINTALYNQVSKLLRNNFNIKHLRGGKSTKKLYKGKKKHPTKDEGCKNTIKPYNRHKKSL